MDGNQPKSQAIKLAYLDELADIIGCIDFDKNEGGKKIIALTDCGMKLITKMKVNLLDVGELQDLFASLQILHNKPELLVELIDRTHSEIINLLGDEAWRIYYPVELQDAWNSLQWDACWRTMCSIHL